MLALHFGAAAEDLSPHADYFQDWLARCEHPAEAAAAARTFAEEAVRCILEQGAVAGREGKGVV
jgi:hypothetical protein